MKRLILALAFLLPSQAFADYATVILADNPLHYYHVGESSGTAAFDNGTASHVTGTYTGTVTLAQAGILGYPTNTGVTLTALTDGYVSLGTGGTWRQPSTTSGVGWSFEGWFKPVTTGLLGEGGASDSGTANNGVWNMLSSTIWRLRLYNTASSCTAVYGNIDSGAIVTTATWHHIVATTLGAGAGGLTRMRLYVDSVLISTLTSFTGSLCTATPLTTFGLYPALIGTNTNGAASMDEIAFYQDSGDGTGELTQTQVTTHYNAGLAAGADVHRYRPFTSKREEWRERMLYPAALIERNAPSISVDEPAFLLDKLNARTIRSPGVYAP